VLMAGSIMVIMFIMNWKISLLIVTALIIKFNSVVACIAHYTVSYEPEMECGLLAATIYFGNAAWSARCQNFPSGGKR
jgi:hypothetical protein